jgi:integrase
LLFLETGIKLEELFALRVSHFDFSNTRFSSFFKLSPQACFA